MFLVLSTTATIYSCMFELWMDGLILTIVEEELFSRPTFNEQFLSAEHNECYYLNVEFKHSS